MATDLTSAERAELLGSIEAEWARYAPLFSAIGARLGCSRAEAIAFWTFLLVNDGSDDPDADAPWRRPPDDET